jgi:surface polysaccharide O-acyltransferase-like enzyme
MVSGMFILDPNKHITITRIYMKYILRILISFVIWGIIYNYISISKNFKTIFINLLHGNVNYHLYFIFYLFGLYIIAPVLRVFTKNATHKEYHYFLIMWFLVQLFINTISLLQLVYINSHINYLYELFKKVNFNFWINYSGFFLLGYYLKTKHISIRSLNILFISGFIGAFLTIYGTFILSRNLGQFKEFFYEYNQPSIIIFSISVFLLIKYLNEKIPFSIKATKLINTLATYTFGVYLLHDVFLIVLFRSSMQFIYNFKINTAILILILSFLVSCISFILMYFWVRLLKFCSRNIKYLYFKVIEP